MLFWTLFVCRILHLGGQQQHRPIFSHGRRGERKKPQPPSQEEEEDEEGFKNPPQKRKRFTARETTFGIKEEKTPFISRIFRTHFDFPPPFIWVACLRRKKSLFLRGIFKALLVFFFFFFLRRRLWLFPFPSSPVGDDGPMLLLPTQVQDSTNKQCSKQHKRMFGFGVLTGSC